MRRQPRNVVDVHFDEILVEAVAAAVPAARGIDESPLAIIGENRSAYKWNHVCIWLANIYFRANKAGKRLR